MAKGAARFAIADFDGDLQPDMATIRTAWESAQSSQYFLEVQLSSGPRPGIGILGPTGGLQITPQDINGDKIADLVITSPFDAHFVAILLNDGRGNFTPAAASDYPDAGKRRESYLVSPGDSGERRLTLEQKRSANGEGIARARGGRPLENSAKLLRQAATTAKSTQIQIPAGRAPPLA